MPIPLLDLKAQYDSIRGEVHAAMQEVLDQTCFILGPPLERFERAFAVFTGCRHAIGVASGTDALHLILRALDIGPGDEVIVPAMTFIATALGVTQAGAKPVFVDVRREDALTDPEKLARAITPRTRAILPVHLYGRCADMNPILEIAADRGLHVVEDACQAHGATCDGRQAGSMGRAAAFSFYPGKNLGAYGDGGAITTNDDALAERLRLLRNWGSRRKYHHEEQGLNSRLDTLQAAVLGVKLRHLARWNELRRERAAWYDAALRGIGGLAPIPDREANPSVYHLYVVRCRERDRCFEALNAKGIQAGIHYPFAVHELRAYRDPALPPGAFPKAEAWARSCLSLPLYPEMTAAQVEEVVSEVKRICHS